MLEGEPIDLLSWFAIGGCPTAGAPPVGDPPPPGGPPPPRGGWYGRLYFFIAFPKAFLTYSSWVGAATVNPTISVGAMVVVLISGMSRMSAA